MKQTDKAKKPEGQKPPFGKPDEKKEKKQPDKPRPEQKGLTKEDLPDSTNESTGQVGSGLRQDSN